MDWKLDGTTGTSLFVFLVVVPVAVNWALRSEMASRDKAEGIEEQARV